MPRTKTKNSLSASSKEVAGLKKELRKINKKLGFGSSKRRLRFGNDEEDEMRAKLLSTGEVELEDIRDLDIEELRQLTESLILSLREQQTAEQNDANEMLASPRSIVTGLSMQNLLSLDREEFDLLYAVHSINMNGDIENPYFRSINYTPLFREYTRGARMEHLNQFRQHRGIWEYRSPAPWITWGYPDAGQEEKKEPEFRPEPPPQMPASLLPSMARPTPAPSPEPQEPDPETERLMENLRRTELMLDDSIGVRDTIEREWDTRHDNFTRTQRRWANMPRSDARNRLQRELQADATILNRLHRDLQHQNEEVELLQTEFNRIRRALSYIAPPPDTLEQIQARLLENGIGNDVMEGLSLEELKELEYTIIETRGCTNLMEWGDGQMVDTISLESPDINNDRIMIVGLDVGRGGREKGDEESSMQVVCLDRQFFISSLVQRMARWVQNPNNEPMTDMGLGGMSDHNVLYFGPLSIINGIAGFLNEDSFNLINNMRPGQNPIFRLEKIIEEERIGNLDNVIGMGNHHGQLPGFPIYRLVRMR